MKMNSLLSSLALTTALFSSVAFAEASEWAVDTTHSTIGFTVPHMVVSEVEGRFKTYSGKALVDEKDLAKSSVEFSADVASIDTGDAKRDEHLKSADFFDAGKFPKLTFTSTKISKGGKGYKIKGNLTIHGVTKEVTLDAEVKPSFGAVAPTNPWGKQVRGVKIGGKVKRSDYGLSWNKTLDKGGVLVGDEVTLDVKLEINRDAAAAASTAPAAPAAAGAAAAKPAAAPAAAPVAAATKPVAPAPAAATTKAATK
ncbi:MAG: protein yceI precursor [Myxococcaceae bacterium]|nr:protein yceI precursor [Myxococcaceae bacterium]